MNRLLLSIASGLLLFGITIGCKTETALNDSASLSEAELTIIRDGFDQRVADVFAAEKGKPLKREPIRPSLSETRPPFTRNYSWSLVGYALRCMWLNEQIDEANAALVENAEFYINNPLAIYDRDNFHWQSESFLRMIELFGQDGTKNPGLLTPETENKILEAAWLYCKRIENPKSGKPNHLSEADHAISDTWYISESENHHVQSFSTLWHFAKLAKDRPDFKDRLYDNGLTAADHFALWNDYAKMYLAERAKKGMFIEMMCIGYNTDLLKGIFNMYDFAEDAELKRRAGLFMDLYFTYWGQEQMDGISGGGKARIYSDIAVGTSGLGYFFFGVGDNPGIKGVLLTAMTTSYRPPLVVVDIVCDRNGRGVYEVIQRPLGLADTNYNSPPLYRMQTDFGGIVRYTYCTPSFIMGTPMSEARPHNEWALISSQNRSHGVIFEGDQRAAILPQCEKNVSRRYFNAQWSAQRKGTLITQKLETHVDAGKSIVWFAKNGLSAPIENKGWIFAESNGAYAALRVVDGSFHWDSTTNAELGKWLYCEYDFSPVILEVVQKSDYPSFGDFQDQITKQKIEFDNNVLTYKSVYGDVFTFYADYSQSPKINNVAIDYAPAKALDSPFLQADWNSGVVHIQKGARNLILDFNSSNGE